MNTKSIIKIVLIAVAGGLALSFGLISYSIQNSERMSEERELRYKWIEQDCERDYGRASSDYFRCVYQSIPH